MLEIATRYLRIARGIDLKKSMLLVPFKDVC